MSDHKLDNYVYHLRWGELSQFEPFQDKLMHHVDFRIAGGEEAPKTVDLVIDPEISFLVRIVPFAWRSIKLED